jgi:hypothetical protein
MRVGPNHSKKFPPVVERSLSRDPYGPKNAMWGRCDSANTGAIEIDPRLSSLHYLDTLIHELLHREFCFLREEVVTEVATVIAKELWEKNFRRLKD